MAGIEPATDGLRNRCSTAELHWLPKSLGQYCAKGSSGKEIQKRVTDLATSLSDLVDQFTVVLFWVGA